MMTEPKTSEVEFRAGRALLKATLAIPAEAEGVVAFAHGSGSSRFSPRNQYVASYLNKAGMATLLLDLLTEEEDRFDSQTGRLRFDIGFLAERLLAATAWLAQHESTRTLAIGYFGASTGVAAALVAAVELPRAIAAIVSRGGRPDLAASALPYVEAPTLLIVGGNDELVIEMNEEALAELRCTKQLEIVPGATHLFEEPGTLQAVAELSTDWFKRYLVWGPQERAESAS